MSAVLMHYSLKLDFEGNNDIDGVVNQFLEQANLTDLDKTVETIGGQCNIRFVVEGPESLDELRQVVKTMRRGLFSAATKEAIKSLKELPSDLYLEITARPPLFGFDDDENYNVSSQYT
jgi:hypothetical protein